AVCVGGALGGQGTLDASSQCGQRCAKLVGGVGGEAADLAERVLQPLEHLVQRLGEPVQLVTGALPGNPARQVFGGDATGAERHGVDGSQRTPCQEQAATGGGHGGGRAPHD